MLPTRSLCVLTVLGTLSAGALSAQIDDGDFQVNTTNAGDQSFPATAMAPDGRFVVVWESETSPGNDNSGRSIVGRLFGFDGQPTSGEFQINSWTAGNQCYPAVAMADDGSFVVTWDSLGSFGNDNSNYSIQARRFAANGTALGPEFQVNTVIDGTQGRPEIAMGADKRFVIVWEGQTPQDRTGSIQGRVFAANGEPLTAELNLNTLTASLQFEADVAMAPSGDWLAVWTTFDPNNGQRADIGGRFVDRMGTPEPVEFKINSSAGVRHGLPAVDVGPDGSFVVVWRTSTSPDDATGGIRGRRYDSIVNAISGEFPINVATEGDQTQPSVGVAASGGFVVVWTSGHETSNPIMARRYRANGQPEGGDFQISQFPTSFHEPAVATGPAERFLVTWQSQSSAAGNDGSGESVQAQLRQGALFLDGWETGLPAAWSRLN
jgi:hypothetical protein